MNNFFSNTKEVATNSLESIFRLWQYKYIIKPFLVTLPTATMACYEIQPLRDKLPKQFIGWLDKNTILLIILFFFLIPICIAVEECVAETAKKIKSSLTDEGYCLLLKALDFGVEAKMNRFLLYMKEQIGSAKASNQVFKDITNPDKQIAEITRAIHIFFESISNISGFQRVEFKTSLFKIENGNAVAAWCYFPESLPPILNDKGSLVSISARDREIIIINDIKSEKEKKKPRISKKCLSDSGSAICYPIICRHTDSTPLAIRIVADSNFFTTRKKKFYEMVFKRFEKRILIEYALSELKQKAI